MDETRKLLIEARADLILGYAWAENAAQWERELAPRWQRWLAAFLHVALG